MPPFDLSITHVYSACLTISNPKPGSEKNTNTKDLSSENVQILIGVVHLMKKGVPEATTSTA